MPPESRFFIGPNQPKIGKMMMKLLFVDTKTSSNIFDVVLFL